jgi:hypothetical protein
MGWAENEVFESRGSGDCAGKHRGVKAFSLKNKVGRGGREGRTSASVVDILGGVVLLRSVEFLLHLYITIIAHPVHSGYSESTRSVNVRIPFSLGLHRFLNESFFTMLACGGCRARMRCSITFKVNILNIKKLDMSTYRVNDEFPGYCQMVQS